MAKNNTKIAFISFFCLLAACIFILNNVSFSLHGSAADKMYVAFKNAAGQESSTFTLKVADTDAKRERGLMYVKSMPADEGMIFIYPEEQIQTFWMKNTFIPLDLIFISKDQKVVGIINDARIMSEKSLSIKKPSLYVIELNAGTAKEVGIEVGTEITFK